MTANRVDNRVSNLPILGLWLAVSALLIAVSWEQISTGIGWGPDDQLRQVQLRDWLAGQSWFDTIQYRIAAPDSQPMHWPRWIEIPLALVVVILSPLVGATMAETAAMVIVPLIALGLCMGLIARITAALFDSKIGLFAAALTGTAVPLIVQLRPMRIDHHGWQVVLALSALWSMFWPDKRKGGLMLGSAMALWLSISLEGLPLSVAFVAFLAWRWAVSLDEGVRLFWTLASFLFSSGVLYLATQGGLAMAANYCDALSPAHLMAFAGGAVIILPALKLLPPTILLRLVALAVAGGAALVPLYYAAPQCLGNAFSDLDPLVRDYWLVNVREGLPIWIQPWDTTVTLYGGAILVGFVSLIAIAVGRADGIGRDKLILAGYAFLWALIVSLLVQRAAAVAAAYAVPFMAWAVFQAFAGARAIKTPLWRILATASVVFLIMPGPLAMSLVNGIRGESAEAPQSDRLGGKPACDSHVSIARLNALPSGMLLAPLDLGPDILVQTPHSVLATSHHRNDQAMADQIRIFTAQPDTARQKMAARDIRYVIICAEDDEMALYRKRHPGSFADQLLEDDAPGWLRRIHLKQSPLRVWRVLQD